MSETWWAFVRWVWWHARFFGHAAMQRDFEDPRVQSLVKEKFDG